MQGIRTIDGIRYRSIDTMEFGVFLGGARRVHSLPEGCYYEIGGNILSTAELAALAARYDVPYPKVALSRLPSVPGWPLPGHAPQFLSDKPDTVLQEGDLVLLALGRDLGDFGVRKVRADGFCKPGDTLHGTNHHGSRSYLIARKDPEADA